MPWARAAHPEDGTFRDVETLRAIYQHEIGLQPQDDIIAYCRSLMSGFKTPKIVVFGPIPKTSTGKIQKFLLRDQVQSAKAISA